MAPRTDDFLQSAWRALEDDSRGDGWRTISIETVGRCRILAGRHFQGGEESLLVGFTPTGIVIDSGPLPRGRGFRVESVKEKMPGDVRTWVALTRQPDGSAVIFARMADDVLVMLRSHDGSDAELFRLFTGRIRAWQAFMERGWDEMLGATAEVGLVGELSFLRQLLDTGVSESVALDGWRGPLDGLHDFALGTGAMEVKASVASGEFPAVVGSLEQLDNSLVQPLFLVGIRLALDASGQALPTLVAGIDARLCGDAAARARFRDLIIRAGFMAGTSMRYCRRFRHVETAIFLVGGEFPRLTRGNVVRAIRRIRYELDLNMVDVPRVELVGALAVLQVT